MTSSGGISAGALPPTVTHELHEEHKLCLVSTRNFGCDVCKQYGEGSTEHYRCEPCDFDAHAECAMAPTTLKHVNYPGDMVLCSAGSGSGDPQRYCDLCARQVLGYRYHNRVTDHRLHPCCAFLPRRVIQDSRVFHLGYHPSGKCGMCKKRSTASLSYRSTYDDGEELFLHVRCLVDTNNRLTGYPDWVASAPIRPGVMGSFTRKKEGGDLLKAAKVSFGVLRFVLHVATFDFDSAAGAVKDVVDVAKDVLNIEN